MGVSKDLFFDLQLLRAADNDFPPDLERQDTQKLLTTTWGRPSKNTTNENLCNT